MMKFTWRLLALVTAGPLLLSSARANIYATDLNLNGAPFVVTNAAPGSIAITFILNEPATLGATIAITSGSNLVRTLTAPPGANGALLGSNLLVWDGNDTNGNPVPAENYAVTVTPAAVGFTNWTQTSLDSNPGNYVFDPRGLAVNNNSNSPFYGRIFLGNAGTGPNPDSVPGDNDTILKLNADGSFSWDGSNGTGGFDGIFDDGFSDVPLKMRVADDDRLYMNDLTDYGEVVSFDMMLASYLVVLDANNYTENPFWFTTISTNVGGARGWFSMDITAAGTANGLLWLGDNDSQGAGVWNWHLINGVADPNDYTGNWAVADTNGSPLNVAASGGLMVDTNLDIFLGQYLTGSANTNACCMVFSNWNGGKAFAGAPVTNATGWTAGGNDSNFLGVFDVTIDSRRQPKYVACALNGGPGSAGIRILNATNGSVVVSNLSGTNGYFVTAWDNVGNLYAATGAPLHVLRVFSPPSGTNQASTSALVWVLPQITGFSVNQTTVTVNFVASTNDIPGQFFLQSSASAQGPFANVPGAAVLQVSPGAFSVSTPLNPGNGPTQFYLIGMTLTP